MVIGLKSHVKAIIGAYIYLLLLIMSASLYAQKGNIRFKHISVGSSNVPINCILQDKKGFMWFGTQDGLTRYDGYEFRIYRHDPDDPTTISDNHIWSMWQDKEGMFWIGTRSGGLNRFDPTTERFVRYLHDAKNFNSLSHNDVRCIMEDSSGMFWIGTAGGGLDRFDRIIDGANRWGQVNIYPD